MPEQERKEVLEAFAVVDKVILTGHKKNTKNMGVNRELRILRPHVFAKGGDRHSGNIPSPEVSVCEEIGCQIVNDIGFGGKVQSSSDLVKRANQYKINNKK